MKRSSESATPERTVFSRAEICGKLQSVSTPRRASEFVQPQLNSDGDLVVGLKRKDGTTETKLLAEMVAQAFLGPKPSGAKVSFLNGDRRDCRAENLAYTSE
jgi:hypothetical protein